MGVKRVELWIAALMALALFTPIFSGYVLGVAILILVAVDRANIHDSRPKKIFRRLTVPLGWRLLTLWICIFAAATGAALMTENPDWKQFRSATGNFAVKYVLLFLALRLFWERALIDPKLARLFVRVLCGASVVHMIYCVAQRYYGMDWAHGFSAQLGPGRYAYGVYRISGFMGHPLTLGYCQALMVVSSLGLALMERGSRAKISWYLIALMSMIVLILSGSRGPLLVAVIACATSVPGSVWRRHWRILAVVGALSASLFMASGSFSRYLEIFTANQGGDARLTHWQVFRDIFLDFPVFGIGPAASREAISAYYKSLGANDNIRLAHNAFLQFAGEFGLVGLLGALNLIWGWVRLSSDLSAARYAMRGLTLAVILGAMTQNNLQDSQFMFGLLNWTLIIVLYEVRLRDEYSGRNQNDDHLTREGREGFNTSG
jgi:O-antigen ligase